MKFIRPLIRNFCTKSQLKVFTQSINSTVQGFNNLNTIVEFDDKMTQAQKKGKKRFLIYRYNPEVTIPHKDPQDKPKYMSFYVDITKFAPMYLDALLYIKDNLDSTLSLRRSCREGICGSCSMNCDGLHSLACIKAVDRDLEKPSIITPLGHMFVLKGILKSKDLVVDMTNFYSQYKMIDPYLKRKTPKQPNVKNAYKQKEFIQSQQDRAKLDGLYECVLCASCTTSCPSYWWHPQKYLGPAVLMQAYRWIIDSRDEYRQQRLQKLGIGQSLQQCNNIGICSYTCPKGLDPRQSIQKLMSMTKQLKQKQIMQQL